jgi:hypothetical protein
MIPRRSSRRLAAFSAVFGLRPAAPATPQDTPPPAPPISSPATALIDARDQDRDRTWRRHNGGPPLDDHHIPEWGEGSIADYFQWKAACAAAWSNIPHETALRRLARAELLGLTYREYALEILERGRFLGVRDVDRIAEIVAMRG